MVRVITDGNETKMKYPKGYSERDDGYKKIAVRFRTDTFDKILAKAQRENRSFSAVVDDIMSRHFWTER